MNTFGRLFRISIFGESHGESIGVLIDGCPPGIALQISDFFDDIKRRKSGQKVLLHERKMTFHSYYQEYLRVIRLVHQFVSVSGMRTQFQEITQLQEKFQGPVMPILLLIKNSMVLMTSEVEDISAAG